MQRSNKKIGISLTHQISHHQSLLDESKVRKVKIRPTLNNSKESRFSSAQKPKIIFSYSSLKSSKTYQNKLSQSSNVNASKQLEVKQVFINEPSQKSSRVQAQKAASNVISNAASTQTQRKRLSLRQQLINHNKLKAREIYTNEKGANRKGKLHIANKVIDCQAEPSLPVEITVQNIEFKMEQKDNQSQKPIRQRPQQYYKSLQAMQKRLLQIIQICDRR